MFKKRLFTSTLAFFLAFSMLGSTVAMAAELPETSAEVTVTEEVEDTQSAEISEVPDEEEKVMEEAPVPVMQEEEPKETVENPEEENNQQDVPAAEENQIEMVEEEAEETEEVLEDLNQIIETPASDKYLTYISLFATTDSENWPAERLAKTRGIKGDFWIADFEEDTLEYTGTAVTQNIKVYDQMDELVLNKDYKLTYKNNINAKDKDQLDAPSVTITFIGQYVGTKVFTYTINQADINSPDVVITSEKMGLSYTGKDQKYVPVVTYKGKKLANNTDFEIKYSGSNFKGDPNTNVTVNYELKGKKNFKNTRTGLSYNIIGASKNFSKGKVTITNKNVKFNGTALKDGDFGIVFKLNGEELPATKYKVDILPDRMSVGTKTIVVTPQNTSEYAGSATATCKVVGAVTFDKNTADFSSSVWKDSIEFSQKVCKSTKSHGMEQQTASLIKVDGKTLTEGVDYTVTYTGNTKVGGAKATFKGLGKYNGTVVKAFKIVPSPAFSCLLSGYYTYKVGGTIPSDLVVVDSDGNVLADKKDYVVTYGNNKAVGTATYKIVGKGNYSKDKVLEGTFTITPGKLTTSGITITAPDKVWAEKAGAYKTEPVILDVNGKKLTAGKDYSKNYEFYDKSNVRLKDDAIVAAGSKVKIRVYGMGNFDETSYIEATYTVYEKTKDIKKLFIKIDPQMYMRGKKCELVLGTAPGTGDIHVFLTKADMQAGTNEQRPGDYVEIVPNSYAKNDKVGNATVILRAVNTKGYGGQGSYKFAIQKKNPGLVNVTSATLESSVFESGTGTTPTAKMKPKQIATVRVNVAPASTDEVSIYWSSSKKDVATVQKDGLDSSKAEIEAKALGTTEITATVVDSTGKKITATAKVVVDYVKLNSVKLDATVVKLKKGEYKDLTATIAPVTAEVDTQVWSSVDEGIATVTKTGGPESLTARVDAVENGITTVSFTVTDISGASKMATCLIMVGENSSSTVVDPTGMLNVVDYGADGTDEVSDKYGIQGAIDDARYSSSHDVWIPAGTYIIKVPTERIYIHSGVNVYMDKDAEIKAVFVDNPSTTDLFRVVQFNGAQNASIHGGKITGTNDSSLHKSSDDEGHCIEVVSSQNITIDGVEIANARGDGIYINRYTSGGNTSTPSGIVINNCNVHHSGRNNLALTSGENIVITGTKFDYANQSYQGVGVCFETNIDTEPVQHVYMIDCSMTGNKRYPLIFIRPTYDVHLINCTVNGEMHNRACGALVLEDCTINGSFYEVKQFSITEFATLIRTTITGDHVKYDH